MKDYVRKPVSDWDDRQYSKDLFEAMKTLDQLHEANQKVFIFCSAGVSRSPTLATTYLSMYMKSKNW